MKRLSRIIAKAKALALTSVIASILAAGAHAQEIGGADDDEDIDISDPIAIAKQLGVSGDDMRPDDQFEMALFGRPLIVGGELEAAGQARRNLDPDTGDGIARLTPEVQVEFLYALSDNAVAFAKVKAFSEDEIWSEGQPRESGAGVDIREAWVLVPRLFGSNVSLQIGKQQYQDRREWWWNENLDSVRFHYMDGAVSGYLGLAETFVRTSTLEDVHPAEQEVFRILGNAAYAWGRHDRIEAFLLSQNDHSSATQIGAIVGEDDADEEDGDLTWLGVRGRTRQKLDDFGKLYVNLDLATVNGEVTEAEFDDAAPGFLEAVDTVQRNVSSWAGELALSWELPFDHETVISAAYAYGEGDADPADNEDKNFRQTGLQGNNGKFRGISRFRYYGETLRPELSNIGLATVSAGSVAPSPMGGEGWIELVYHNYRQVELSTTFQTDRLDVDPDGLSRDIGDGVDVVYSFELNQNWEFEATLGGFRYGEAFGTNEGKWASSFSFKLDYNF